MQFRNVLNFHAPLIRAPHRIPLFQCFVALALLVSLTTASTVLGQISLPDEFTAVSYSVGGSVNSGGGLGTSWGGTDVRTAFGHASTPVSLAEEWETEVSNATHGNASAIVSVSAQAEVGNLRVGLTSGGMTVNTNPSNGSLNDLRYGSARMSTGRVLARWQDTAVADAAGGNRTTIFLGLLEITGEMDLNLLAPVIPPGTANTDSGSGADLMIRLFSSNQLIQPYPGGYVGRVRGGTIPSPNDLNDLPTTFIPVQMIMRDGEPFTIDYILELMCTAASQVNTNSTSGVSTAVHFNVDFTHTLRWGGITSATDLDTGLPVTDYSIISASGFDYRNPAPVPEPASASLIALTLLLNRRRRK